MNGPTHASFFSGAGGLDIGLERAGFRTVSFSEIDPYASAVLAQRWPGVPNLGDITALAADGANGSERAGRIGGRAHAGRDGIVGGVPADCVPSRVQQSGHTDDRWSGTATGSAPRSSIARGPDWRDATLWSGGFPCQDLSVAGKRRGLAGSRSGLAFSFLDLVGRHRPRFVLLENVPGLLSSHGGKDFGTLLATLVELGYGVGYRVLDARYFGVPQRRRRVFILGDSLGGRAGAERAAEVLSVGSRCRRHPPTGIEAGPGAAAGARPGVDGPRLYNATAAFGDWAEGDEAGTLSRRDYKSPNHLLSSSPDSRGVRTPDGLARRSHDRDGVAAFTKSHNVAGPDDPETWETGREARSMNGFDGDRTTLVLGDVAPDPLLPLGLDSHRYRCCGNGVVADVGEYIGRRLMDLIEAEAVA